MGSTVIVLMEKDRLQWLPETRPGMAVRMGQALGRVSTAP